MDKRRARYEQAERTTSAESKVKALRLEVHELRKQLFRAEESARLANEEATARAQAQRQSGEALRASNAALDKRYCDLFAAFERRGEELQEARRRADASLWHRLAVRFGRAA